MDLEINKGRTNQTINFIIFDLGKNGGTKDIIIIANYLHNLGYNVNIIYPRFIFPNPFNCNSKIMFLAKIKRIFDGLMFNLTSDRPDFRSWVKIKANLVCVPFLADKFIPPAIATFATWWETAYYVSQLSKSKGKKIYLIQHFETWAGNKKRVENSYYKLGLTNLVHSKWLQEKIPISVKILHAPDHSVFYPESVEKNDGKIRVMIFERKEKWKASNEGIEAFKLAKQQCNQLELIVVKDVFDDNKLRYYYNLSDIFLFTSHIEGLGLPPMEAMCCKSAVITTNVGAVPDYCVNGVNSIVIPPGDIKAMANSIVDLAKNKKLREKIASNGYTTIQKLTWDKQVRKIEKILK